MATTLKLLFNPRGGMHKRKDCAYLHRGGAVPICTCLDKINDERQGKSIFIDPDEACKSCLFYGKKFLYGSDSPEFVPIDR